MLYGINEKGKMVNILESIEGVEYRCPICKEKLIRCLHLIRTIDQWDLTTSQDIVIKIGHGIAN